MTVRIAKFGDIPRVVTLVKESHRRSSYAHYKMDENSLKEFCMESIRSGNGTIIVWDVAGMVEGYIIGITDRLYQFLKVKYATDILTYVSNAGRGGYIPLLTAFENWAFSIENVVEIWLGASDGIEDPARIEKIHNRLGYTRLGIISRKRKLP